MTTTTATQPLAGRGGLALAVRDIYAIMVRNLTALTRVPQYLVFSTIQPVVFVLMFRYVFGGAIDTGSVPYVDFLMPGIFVQTAAFGALGSAIGLAADLKSGLLERFQSLPMARSALLAGRTFADLVRNVFVAGLMSAIGFAVGFRLHASWLAFLAGIGILLLFGYTMSWIYAAVGLLAKDPETAQAAAFPVLAPLVFASSAFVPIETMPDFLEAFARYQPVSVTITAIRNLTLGLPAGNDVLGALAWFAGLLLVFIPLSIRLYRRAI